MDEQTLYMAALTIYENNFRILHWKLSGTGFHTAHVRFGEYYDKLGDMLDETAELIISTGGKPVSSNEAMHMIEESDKAFTLIDSSRDYTEAEADMAAYSMLQLLYDLSSRLADASSGNAVIADFYMDHAKYYHIEGLYKLARSCQNQ